VFPRWREPRLPLTISRVLLGRSSPVATRVLLVDLPIAQWKIVCPACRRSDSMPQVVKEDQRNLKTHFGGPLRLPPPFVRAAQTDARTPATPPGYGEGVGKYILSLEGIVCPDRQRSDDMLPVPPFFKKCRSMDDGGDGLWARRRQGGVSRHAFNASKHFGISRENHIKILQSRDLNNPRMSSSSSSSA